MSEPAPAKLPSLPSIIISIITDDACTIKALATTSANSLDYAMLLSSYENAISLACVVYSSENLTDQFAALVTKNEDLMLERDAAVTDHNTLTAQVTQLEAQLAQTLTLQTLLQAYRLPAVRGRLTPRSSLGKTVAS
jgi:hypothetical protein